MTTENWDLKTFPDLHIDGINGVDQKRRVKLSMLQYFEQRILNKDSRFSRSPDYVFAAFAAVERQRLDSNVGISFKRGQRQSDGTYTLNDPYSVLDNTPGTPRYWQKKKYELIARLENLGAFQLFFTLSCADMRWNENFTTFLDNYELRYEYVNGLEACFVKSKINKNLPETSLEEFMKLEQNKTKFEYAGAAGGYLDFFGYPYCRGRVFNSLENDNNQYNDTTDIFWASGACFFIRSSVFHQLDGFDEQFFAHQEEIDLCWRAKNEDFNIKYIGTSTVFHIGGATLNEASPRKTFLNFRNSLFTATKNLPKRYLFLVIFSRLLLDAVAGIKFIIDLKPLHTWAIIKAHFSFYRFMPAMIKKRLKTSYKSNEYYQCKSVVWQHFILGRRKFDQIN